MAAVFYSPVNNAGTIFKSGVQVNTSIRIPFLDILLGSTGTNAAFANGFSIVTEVVIQNKDTIQYFLTFDDLISYFYFGKGLGTISINGMLFSDCNGYFRSLNTFNSTISNIRGKVQNISFGNAVFSGVISAFTVRASGEEAHCVEFNIQMDIIDHSLVPPRFTAQC